MKVYRDLSIEKIARYLKYRMLTWASVFFCPEVLNDSCSVLLLLKAKFSGVIGQKQQIIALRRDGARYGRIAAQLQLSINTVKSFCRRHSLAARTDGAVCKQCGKPIAQNPGRKRKRFCCDACRNKWWNAHLELVKRKAVYTYICLACGKGFMVYGNSHRKLCSHACYITYRFGGVRHG